MEGLDFLNKLKQLVAREDIIGIAREINELNASFQDYVIECERLLQIKQMDAQEQDADIPEDLELEKVKTEFREIYALFREQRRRAIDEKNAIELEHLRKKQALIEQLRTIIQHEENIHNAFTALKDIQSAWKEIGDIPREQRDPIQSEYSRLIEDFFYNINIYKELKENDLKRNTQMKQEIVEKLQKLQEIQSIKEVEQQLKILQNNWDDVGPVNNDQWEIIKDEYWKAVHTCYSRIKMYYEEQRAVLLKNIEQKKEIVQEVAQLIEQIPQDPNHKLWDEMSNQIMELQQKWKQIGFGTRKENEEVWQSFRNECNRFFEMKKQFFKAIHRQQNEYAQEKQALIEQAEALKDSNDWKNTANALIQLQKQWKKIGNAGQRNEPRLWKQFRAACNTFFDRRNQYFENIDAEFEGNLIKKQQIIEQIKSYSIPDNKQQALNELKQFTAEFNAVGKVPMKEKETIYRAFKTAIDKQYKALKLEGIEKDKILFQAHIETIIDSPEASKLFSKEKSDMRRKIDHLKREVFQLENNLGFLGRSQRAEHLKRDVEKKIERSKNEIQSLQQRIKMISEHE